MTKADILESVTRPVSMINDAAGIDTALNMSIVYQDPSTRLQAFQVWERMTKIAGEESVRSSWWEMGDLTHPLLLTRSVHDAIEADVIVIAVHAEEALPIDLYVWIDAWLPRRLWRSGVLVAMPGVVSPSASCCPHAREYLGAVARRGHLDFHILEWKGPPISSPPPSGCRRSSRMRRSSGPEREITFPGQERCGVAEGRQP